jgi:DNA-binding transcriptional MerR regulator
VLPRLSARHIFAVMADDPLMTLRQVADSLGLPESTTRFYRDAFLDFIPLVGTGRRRRYPPPAVAVLRTIAEGYTAGRTRHEIAQSLEAGSPSAAGAAPLVAPPRPRRHRSDVSNLELLAAIVDGEREQRDALWQMAQEVVRLADVLDGQEKLLAAIASDAGVRPRLVAGAAPLRFAEPAAAAVPGPDIGAGAPETKAHRPDPPDPTASAARPAAGSPGAGGEEVERLRAALANEQQLVDRLREAKVKLEHRVTDAEAALAEHRDRKLGSVLGRILSREAER